MDTAAEVDFTGRYESTTMPGVAWRLIDYVERPVEVSQECRDGECPWWRDEDVFVPVPHYHYDVEMQPDHGWVSAVMVGDDRRIELEVESLRPLLVDSFCSVCGQIGCQHDGRSTD